MASPCASGDGEGRSDVRHRRARHVHEPALTAAAGIGGGVDCSSSLSCMHAQTGQGRPPPHLASRAATPIVRSGQSMREERRSRVIAAAPPHPSLGLSGKSAVALDRAHPQSPPRPPALPPSPQQLIFPPLPCGLQAAPVRVPSALRDGAPIPDLIPRVSRALSPPRRPLRALEPRLVPAKCVHNCCALARSPSPLRL